MKFSDVHSYTGLGNIGKMANGTNKEWKTQMYTFMMPNKIYNRNTIFVKTSQKAVSDSSNCCLKGHMMSTQL